MQDRIACIGSAVSRPDRKDPSDRRSWEAPDTGLAGSASAPSPPAPPERARPSPANAPARTPQRRRFHYEAPRGTARDVTTHPQTRRLSRVRVSMWRTPVPPRAPSTLLPERRQARPWTSGAMHSSLPEGLRVQAAAHRVAAAARSPLALTGPSARTAEPTRPGDSLSRRNKIIYSLVSCAVVAATGGKSCDFDSPR